jgi:hypothetical protein
MIKFNSKIMELKSTHHSQFNLTAQAQAWGENPSAAKVGELGQHKLQMSMASASSK